jgi:hypothetical protein
MVYINIPYVTENNRIDKDFARSELQILDISDEAKKEAFRAIYDRKIRGVNFDAKDTKEVLLLEKTLARLGVPFRQTEESEY